MNSYQFEHIHAKSAKVIMSPKGRLFIKAGSRIYLESLFDSLESKFFRNSLVVSITYVISVLTNFLSLFF